MKTIRRIAAWNPPAPKVKRPLLRAIVDFFSPFKYLLLIAAVLPVAVLLLYPDAGIFLWVLKYLSLPLLGIAILLGFTNPYFYGPLQPLPEYDHGDALPRMNVTLRFEVDGYVYGEDRGELTIVDGWFVFEGERTDFCISPADAEEPTRLAKFGNKEQVSLKLKVSAAKVRIRIASEDQHRDPGTFLDSWIYDRVADPEITVLPPLEPLPGFRRGLSYRIDETKAITAIALSSIFSGPFAAAAAYKLGLDVPGTPLANLVVMFLIWMAWRFFALRQMRRAFRSLAVANELICAAAPPLPPIPPIAPALQQGAWVGVRERGIIVVKENRRPDPD